MSLLEMQHPDEEINQAWKDRNYEQLQEMFDESRFIDPVQWLGFQHKRQAHLFDWGVNKYGGSFINKLKTAYAGADMHNQRKIRKTWPDLWIKYVVFGRKAEIEAHEQTGA